jgi:DNA-binding NtrC family response regulator
MSKVLIIDDDRSVRHTVECGLNGYCGIKVVTAADGDIGLELIEKEMPQVVLLDVYLPNHNGLELFRKIRAIDRKLPVIFVTGDTSSETAIQAMRVGAFDYLSKPLDIAQVKNLTLSAIKARRMMDEPVAFQVGVGNHVANGSSVNPKR